MATWIFTDIADWFDQQKRQANRALDSAVETSGYNQGVMLVAAGTHAAMEFGGAFVDILRLGDGVRAGGLGGWGKDALRMVAIFPVGKAAQMMKTMKGTKAAQVVVDSCPEREYAHGSLPPRPCGRLGIRSMGKYWLR
jgi:hypothetical protein